MRTCPLEEQALAHFIERLLLRVNLRQIELHALRLGGDPGDQCGHVVLLAPAEGRLSDLDGVEALQGFHAGQQARLEVLHLVGV